MEPEGAHIQAPPTTAAAMASAKSLVQELTQQFEVKREEIERMPTTGKIAEFHTDHARYAEAILLGLRLKSNDLKKLAHLLKGACGHEEEELHAIAFEADQVCQLALGVEAAWQEKFGPLVRNPALGPHLSEGVLELRNVLRPLGTENAPKTSPEIVRTQNQDQILTQIQALKKATASDSLQRLPEILPQLRELIQLLDQTTAKDLPRLAVLQLCKSIEDQNNNQLREARNQRWEKGKDDLPQELIALQSEWAKTLGELRTHCEKN